MVRSPAGPSLSLGPASAAGTGSVCCNAEAPGNLLVGKLKPEPREREAPGPMPLGFLARPALEEPGHPTAPAVTSAQGVPQHPEVGQRADGQKPGGWAAAQGLGQLSRLWPQGQGEGRLRCHPLASAASHHLQAQLSAFSGLNTISNGHC